MNQAYFITGTDTDAGKTLVTAALMIKAKSCGFSVKGLKPVAAGLHEGKNSDALVLQSLASKPIDYKLVNPLALAQAASPHIAAKLEGKSLDIHRLEGFVRGAALHKSDFTFVEGAGGWLVPLNAQHTMADFAQSLGLPIILVVGLRLGCLNHTLLSVQAILDSGLELAAWVGCQVEGDMAFVEENMDTLKQKIAAPCLGYIPRVELEHVGDAKGTAEYEVALKKAELAASHIELSVLMQNESSKLT